MYYVRTFEGGGAFYDPRRQKYAEFKCDLCGHLHHVNLSQYPNYDLTKTFPCKKCGKLDKNDEINSLQTEKINLFKEIEQKKKRILEIENKIKELVPDSEFDFPSFVSEETKDFIRGTRLLTNQIIKSGKSKEFLVKAGIYNEDDSLTEKYIWQLYGNYIIFNMLIGILVDKKICNSIIKSSDYTDYGYYGNETDYTRKYFLAEIN